MIDRMEAEKRFAGAISTRMESDVWNLQMAGRVLQARRKRGYRMAWIFSLSMACASVVLVTVLFGVNRTPVTYDSFITTQVDGAYKASGLSGEDVDSLIDEALAMR